MGCISSVQKRPVAKKPTQTPKKVNETDKVEMGFEKFNFTIIHKKSPK